MNQSVMITTAAKRQNSLTGARLIDIYMNPSTTRSVKDVIAIVVPTLLNAKPIRTGTE